MAGAAERLRMELHMKIKTTISILLLMAGAFMTMALTGCGGGGGGENTDPASMVATLCAGTLTYQDSGEQNILFAAVKGAGSGVSGWVEDQNGKKIANLSYVSAANSQEATLTAANTPLTPGKYTLYYSVNSETFSVSRTLNWGAALPRFQSMPNPPEWNPTNRTVSVAPVTVTPGIAAYYLRVYSAISYDYLYTQSTPVPGGVLSEYLSSSNNQFRIMVVADVSEGAQIVATARYFFKADTY
jgi:hypothetical protein